MEGNVRAGGENASAEPLKVTRSIMIVKPPSSNQGDQTGTPPASPAGSTPPISPLSGKPLLPGLVVIFLSKGETVISCLVVSVLLVSVFVRSCVGIRHAKQF